LFPAVGIEAQLTSTVVAAAEFVIFMRMSTNGKGKADESNSSSGPMQ
jgi:hypothetical protein